MAAPIEHSEIQIHVGVIHLHTNSLSFTLLHCCLRPNTDLPCLELRRQTLGQLKPSDGQSQLVLWCHCQTEPADCHSETRYTLMTENWERRVFISVGKKQQEHTNRGRGTQNTCARSEHSSAASGHVSLHGKHSPEHRFSSAPLPNHSPVSSGGGATDPAQQPTSQPADQCDIIIIASVCWKALLLTTIVSLTLVWFVNSSVKLTAFSSSSWLSSICESKDRHATLRFWWPDWQKERERVAKRHLWISEEC